MSIYSLFARGRNDDRQTAGGHQSDPHQERGDPAQTARADPRHVEDQATRRDHHAARGDQETSGQGTKGESGLSSHGGLVRWRR